MRTYILAALFLASFSFSCFGYNHRKCTLAYKDYYPIGMFMSTSGFTSSTGKCAAFGSINHKKKMYVAQNLEALRAESAQGGGEYINNYASLSGCSKIAAKRLGESLQASYKQVFSFKEEEIFSRIEAVMGPNCQDLTY